MSEKSMRDVIAEGLINQDAGTYMDYYLGRDIIIAVEPEYAGELADHVLAAIEAAGGRVFSADDLKYMHDALRRIGAVVTACRFRLDVPFTFSPDTTPWQVVEPALRSLHATLDGMS